MSSEKVQDFLQKKEQEKEKQEAELKYNILSYYGLGEAVYYKEGDNPDDFPLGSENGTIRFRYDCDITEEDFTKIKAAYEKDTKASINDKSETTLNACAVILLIIGILVLIVTSFVAIDQKSWSLFGIGLGIFLTFLIEYAFAKVIVNISCKLNKLYQ